MSYRYLSRESMVSLTSPLVNEDHADCRAIKSDPLGRALWEVVAGAHVRLVSTQRTHPSLARLGQIRDELARLRERHGQVVRGIYYMLQAQEELAGDAVLAAEVRRLRARIFPDNLMATRRSNRALAGQALLLRSRLTAEDLAMLGELGTRGGTLVDAVNEWFAIAAAMGELENERSGGEDTPTGADVAAARAHWIRTVQAFIATLRLRDDLPAAIASILDRIERVVRSAGPRRARTPASDDTIRPGDAMSDAASAGDAMRDAASAGDAMRDAMSDAASAGDAMSDATSDAANSNEQDAGPAFQPSGSWRVPDRGAGDPALTPPAGIPAHTP